MQAIYVEIVSPFKSKKGHHDVRTAFLLYLLLYHCFTNFAILLPTFKTYVPDDRPETSIDSENVRAFIFLLVIVRPDIVSISNKTSPLFWPGSYTTLSVFVTGLGEIFSIPSP